MFAMLVHGLPYPTYLLPADSADIGIATTVRVSEFHVVSLVRARDPLHAAASGSGEVGYRFIDVVQLFVICIKFVHYCHYIYLSAERFSSS